MISTPARLRTCARLYIPNKKQQGPSINGTLITHLSVGNGPEAWGWAAATYVLWGMPYFWRRLHVKPASADRAPSAV